MSKTKECLEKANKYFMPSLLHQYFDEPIVVEKAEMEYMYDAEGNKYLDCFSGILVTNSGHCNSEITERVIEQSKKVQHVSSCFLTKPMVELTEKLSNITPGKLQKSFLVNTGSEAIDGAINLARIHTGKENIVSLRHGYHGRTTTANAVTGVGSWRFIHSDPAGIHFAINPYCYRCPLDKEYPKCDLACVDHLEDVIKESCGGRVAGILIETIQGVGGYVIPPYEYFKRVKEVSDIYEALLIIDEVQTGFGRTGKMFGIEHWDVEPDIICMAKGIANGFPMGAYIAQPDVADSFTAPSISTFGGNPISSIATLANIEFIENNNLCDNAKEVGEYGIQKLREISMNYDFVGEIRGKGLMLALEILKKGTDKRKPGSEEAVQLMENLKDEGVIAGKAGVSGSVVRFAPPLTISKEQMDVAIKAMDKSLGRL